MALRNAGCVGVIVHALAVDENPPAVPQAVDMCFLPSFTIAVTLSSLKSRVSSLNSAKTDRSGSSSASTLESQVSGSSTSQVGSRST